jgi:uncharacterized membrane protein HdeD (DUF308 family)
MSSGSLLGEARRYWQMSLVRGIIAIIFGLLAIFWPHVTYSLFFYIFGGFAIVEGLLLIANSASGLNTGAGGRAAHQQPDFYQSGASAPGSAPSQRGVPPQDSSAYRAGTTGTTPAGNASQQTGAPLQGSAGYQGAGTSFGRETSQGAGAAFGSAGYRGSPVTRMVTSKMGSTSQLMVGVLSVICGILCFVLPGAVGALVIYAIAAWAMFRGIGALMQASERGWVMGAIGVLAIILSLFLFIDPIGAIRTFLWGIGVFAIIMGVLQVMRGLKENAAATHGARPLEPSY